MSDPSTTLEEQPPSLITFTGFLMGLFVVDMMTVRAGLAPLYHQIGGLLLEHDANQQIWDDRIKACPDFQDSPFSREQKIEVNANRTGALMSYLGMLRLQSSTAALTIINHIDTGTRRTAGIAGVDIKRMRGGPEKSKISMLEMIRATGDWSRHHFQWNDATTTWPAQTLRNLGFKLNDPLLPARVIASLEFKTFLEFETSVIESVRATVRSWNLQKDPPSDLDERLSRAF